MKTITLRLDTYSKVALTLIALALIANLFKPQAPLLAGQSVELTLPDVIDVNLKEMAGQTLDDAPYQSVLGGLPVVIVDDDTR